VGIADGGKSMWKTVKVSWVEWWRHQKRIKNDKGGVTTRTKSEAYEEGKAKGWMQCLALWLRGKGGEVEKKKEIDLDQEETSPKPISAQTRRGKNGIISGDYHREDEGGGRKGIHRQQGKRG